MMCNYNGWYNLKDCFKIGWLNKRRWVASRRTRTRTLRWAGQILV